MNKDELIKSLKEKGFDEKIIKAFSNVRREDFFLADLKENAYEDNAFPIGYSQTISQPYTIAFMLKLLELGDNQDILEIGSGSGYVLALISNISKNSKIIGIERIKELVENSKEKLKYYQNINIVHANGLDIKSKQKFDRILVSASAEEIPTQFFNMLKKDGILVMPVKQDIIKLEKLGRKNKIKKYPGFVFVQLMKN